MKQQFTHWLFPPVFEDNAEKTWRARLLNATMLMMVLFVSLLFIGNLLGGRVPTAVLLIDGTVITVCLALRFLLFRGRVFLTGILLTIIIFTLIMLAVANLGTIRTPTTSFFVLLVIVMGLLFGKNGIIIGATASSLAVLGLIIAENADLLPAPDYTVNITQWFAYLLLFGLAGTLTFFSYQTTYHALERQFQEVAERKQAEENLRHAKEAAEEANRAKSVFLSRMSHELRTPLNGILGYTQIFKRDPALTAEQQKGIDIIHRSGEHLLMMINDILDLSKIEANRIELVPAEISLTQFLQTIAELMKLRAAQKGLTFIYEPSSNLPESFLADETRLRQVLLNLLGNAIKFTAQGSVTLSVRRGDIITANHEEGATLLPLCFEVKDSGVGIPLQQQTEIFEPFRQVGDKQTQHKGTGLGLAISQRLVQMMGGDLQVESGETGSRFWFDIAVPLPISPRESKRANSHRVTGYTRMTGKNSLNLLVVDDVTENRTVLNAFLTPLGFIIHEADSGLSALEKVVQCNPDLILMDVVMPDMDGLETTRQIRQQTTWQQMPIIAISADVDAVAQQKSILAGCDAFLPKPFKTESVLEKLEQYLPLTWLYEDEPLLVNGTHPPTESPQIDGKIPPEITLTKLLNLNMVGDAKAVRACLHTLREEDVEYAPFVNRISGMVAQFDMGGIDAYIKSCLS